MKERPILFSAPMVRALLAGTKTQTRRVVKSQPIPDSRFVGGWKVVGKGGEESATCSPLVAHHSPNGQPGDRLWVRETWGLHAYGDDTDWLKGGCTAMDLADHVIAYRADWGPLQDSCHWRPSIHMPRWASRITLKVTSVRVERLQDISEADALAEGVSVHPDHHVKPRTSIYSPVQAYRDLWEQINGPDSWDANPWVWAIEFKRLP